MPYNEYMDGGVVDVGMGALSLLTVVSHSGPNEGRQTYQLDENMNWNIKADLALDPGFPQGVLTINDIKITTGLISGIYPAIVYCSQTPVFLLNKN